MLKYLILQHDVIYSICELKNRTATMAKIRARNLAIFVLAAGQILENAGYPARENFAFLNLIFLH